jgi:hypothetical protein
VIEREMEDLAWEHPELFLAEPLSQFRRQQRSAVGRSDLIFRDSWGRFLVVELKRGVLPRDALHQLEDYFGAVKREYPDTPVEKMVVANSIPEERRLACKQYNIECREISDKRFREVAEHVGYVFRSEIVQEPERSQHSQPETATNLKKTNPQIQPYHPTSEKRGSRGLWEQRGYQVALAVLDGCFGILCDEIDRSLTINYDALNNIKLERAGKILHCLRFNPVVGALRLSGVVPDRAVWMEEKFKTCGLEPVTGYNKKRARVLVRPDQVTACRGLLLEFFIECGLRP